MSSLWSQPFTDDVAVFNRWLCVSRIRATLAIGVFFPLLAWLGMVRLHALPVVVVCGALAAFSVLALRTPTMTRNARLFFWIQLVVDMAATTLGIGLATHGVVALLARPLYVVVIVPASLVSVPLGLAAAALATLGHLLLLARDTGFSPALLASFNFLTPTFLFFLVAQQGFVYGAHLRSKSATLAALARRLEESQSRLAEEGRLAAGIAEIARTLSASLDDAEPLTRVVRTIRERLWADSCAMFSVDESRFQLLATSEPDIAASHAGIDLPLVTWPAEQRLRAERTLVLAPGRARVVAVAGARPAAARRADRGPVSRPHPDRRRHARLPHAARRNGELGAEPARRDRRARERGAAERAPARGGPRGERAQVGVRRGGVARAALAAQHRARLRRDAARRGARTAHRRAARRARRTDLQASTLLEMIEALLDLNRIEAGRLPVESVEVGLATLLHDVCEPMRRTVARPGVGLHCEVAGDVGALETDPGKLKTIVRNLVHNALKFTERGEVSVSAHRRDGGTIAIEVRDSGCGMPPEALGYVFEMFRQVPGSVGGGVGLGLHIVRRLADVLGAEVSVDSTPGHGSCFTVLVPETRLARRAAERTEAA